jgi:hypothetical protein
VNFVTCHDGFTLRDLVSYERKHNEANGEDNRDGTDANWSRNWGAEGETDSPKIRALRARVARNLLATLAFSQGVPMLSHGDEIGRTQRGNNNAYCQDDETSWVDWSPARAATGSSPSRASSSACATRRQVFRRERFFRGIGGNGSPTKDITWLRRDGAERTAGDWGDGGPLPRLRDLGRRRRLPPHRGRQARAGRQLPRGARRRARRGRADTTGRQPRRWLADRARHVLHARAGPHLRARQAPPSRRRASWCS